MDKMVRPALALLLFGLGIFLTGRSWAEDSHQEKIVYALYPAGKAEYENKGIVEKDGRRLLLVTFKTWALGFRDTEKIYVDPATLLPVKVERDVRMWGIKENLNEEYNQKNFVLTVTKYKNGKKTQGYVFQKDGPLHNAVFLPFYLRSIPKLEVGWSFDARFPTEFRIRLDSIEEITVPAGKFTAYRFSSIPKKFEIWVSQGNPRVPVKIKDISGLGYTMVMKEYLGGKDPERGV